ncbi:TIGR02569 family protein [Glycomyces buryatensis]|nr:TIGR02569 family protein [Glycomyces buryatensis]
MPPSESVLEAFGAAADPELLDGGQGHTWRASSIVLKPAGLAVESRWRASVLETLPDTDRLRIARPVRAASGDWLHEGWEAWHHTPGRTDPKRWDEAIKAGTAFHEAIATVARPDFLEGRDNWWTRADQAAWSSEVVEEVPSLRRLMEARVPVQVRSQLVHGDVLGNVIYTPGQPPTLIDWAPYWRPTSWAAAVAVVDALCWHGADEALIQAWSSLEHWAQMLLRALLFRMITDLESSRARGKVWQPHPAYTPVVKLVLVCADSAS